MKTISRLMHYMQTPGQVFDKLDDLSVTGMHMTTSSTAMMGSKLHLDFLSHQKKGLDTKYRWTGTMMWMKMDFTVLVTKWIAGREKIWETIGEAKMIIYSWYRMELQLTAVNDGTIAELSITYEKPEGTWYRILSFLFADIYCRWCLRNMLRDCKTQLAKEEVHGTKQAHSFQS